MRRTPPMEARASSFGCHSRPRDPEIELAIAAKRTSVLRVWRLVARRARITPTVTGHFGARSRARAQTSPAHARQATLILSPFPASSDVSPPAAPDAVEANA